MSFVIWCIRSMLWWVNGYDIFFWNLVLLVRYPSGIFSCKLFFPILTHSLNKAYLMINPLWSLKLPTSHHLFGLWLYIIITNEIFCRLLGYLWCLRSSIFFAACFIYGVPYLSFFINVLPTTF